MAKWRRRKDDRSGDGAPEPVAPARAPDGLWDPPGLGASLLSWVASGYTDDAALPDDAATDPGQVTFAPGALTGILTHHAAGPGATDVAGVGLVVRALDQHVSGDLDRHTLLAMYAGLHGIGVDAGPPLAAAVSPWAQARVAESPLLEQQVLAAVRQVSGWLIKSGSEREPVQAGIVLASMMTDLGGHERAIATLARHAEFAYDGCRALSRGGEACETLLLDVAMGHRGWGRIHAVECLLGTANTHVRRWLLEDGFRNDVMWEYTAYLVARYCDLAGHLEPLAESEVVPRRGAAAWDNDVALLNGARDILSTLLARDGPSGDIEHYDGSGAAALLWLRATKRRATDSLVVEDYGLLVDLLAALSSDERLSAAVGFTDDVRAELAAGCRSLLAQPCVVEVALSSLALPGGPSVTVGTRVAAALGVDTFPAHLARVRADPEDTSSWWELTQHGGDRAEDVVTAALQLLPADCVDRTGRASIGQGPGPHLAVTFLLQQLVARRAGVGWPLLTRCFDSPLVGPRNQALTTLLAWPRSSWPPDAVPLLQSMYAVESDEQLRARLADVLADES